MLKRLGIVFVCLFLLLPGNREAVAFATTEHNALLEQVVTLTKEVGRLQQILSERTSVPPVASLDSSETRYWVIDGSLVHAGGAADPIHTQLFSDLQRVLGATTVATHLREFRVGHVSDAVLDHYVEGYVERDSTDDQWLMILRRDNTTSVSEEERRLFTNLFIHEYAHILAELQPHFVDTFTYRFWSDPIYRASERVNHVYERRGYSALDGVHLDYTTSFASGYAMLSPDEDIAETFVAFVLRAAPRDVTVLDDKIRFFYTNEGMVQARMEIRDNLGL